MRLLNVRLNPEDARRAADLRKAGVQLSRVVRDAIRLEHEQRIGARDRRRKAAHVMAMIYAEHPDPPDVRGRRYDLRDRRAVRGAIVERLRRRRS